MIATPAPASLVAPTMAEMDLVEEVARAMKRLGDWTLDDVAERALMNDDISPSFTEAILAAVDLARVATRLRRAAPVGEDVTTAARRLLSAAPGENLSILDISKVCRAILSNANHPVEEPADRAQSAAQITPPQEK